MRQESAAKKEANQPYLSSELIQKIRAEAMNVARDTYIVHDYFLYYSPILLAATSVHLCLTSLL